ncbi:MAG TPA: SDR family NAD(P)-dependent oxidoreductase [Chthoniobacterales bacterium]|jgi:NAD(P)-dependent dehydrogenase (short-subunit alcohol dehydrogenase family)|nr:SDR family NAD(P)-dependent oxidoreductase [Chthoniobacterales bacterium]
MDLCLSRKLALVTGSTAGIGAAIAEGLAREHARVIVNGRTEHRVQKAIEAIKTHVEGAAVEGFAGESRRSVPLCALQNRANRDGSPTS